MGIYIVDKWGFSVWTSWLDLCLVTDLVNLVHFAGPFLHMGDVVLWILILFFIFDRETWT
jgi:hypothetical protein